jgi:peptidoglycan/xylan/chitin deacetylase (PgdA/CDA1 family)
VTGGIFFADIVFVVCGIVFIQMQFFGPVFCNGSRRANALALTFDDGPNPAATPALLNLLKDEQVLATFFVIGEHVLANAALTARIAADGHLLGNHTFRHRWFTNLMWPSVLEGEITRTQQAIEKTTAATPLLMRPPMGLTNPLYRRLLRKHGLTMVGWDVRSFDGHRDAPAVIKRVCKRARGGSIILLHDGYSTGQDIAEITRQLIRELRAKGFEFVRVNQMMEGNASREFSTP